MNYRELGSTGIVVSDIGFGAWGIGGESAGATSYGKTKDSESKKSIELAVESGINFFDTAPPYGDGHSEILLGDVLSPIRSQVVLATKIGIKSFDAPPDFSSQQIRYSLYESLRRLKTDYLDLLQIHNCNIDVVTSNPGLLDELTKFRSEGLIREIGVTVKSPLEAHSLLLQFEFATVQVNLNMLDMRAIDCGLLEYAAFNKIGVIARTPMAFGFLSGDIDRETQFSSNDHRSNWPKEQLDRWLEVSDRLFGCVLELSNLRRAIQAIRFCLSIDGVSTVIPGMIKPEEVLENVIASQLGSLSALDIHSIKQEYVKVKDWLIIQ
jgi:aryl-alcohol dehydrogenase-like predicted oxidoreductase